MVLVACAIPLNGFSLVGGVHKNFHEIVKIPIPNGNLFEYSQGSAGLCFFPMSHLSLWKTFSGVPPNCCKMDAPYNNQKLSQFKGM